VRPCFGLGLICRCICFCLGGNCMHEELEDGIGLYILKIVRVGWGGVALEDVKNLKYQEW
jgi:hypothetical protein